MEKSKLQVLHQALCSFSLFFLPKNIVMQSKITKNLLYTTSHLLELGLRKINIHKQFPVRKKHSFAIFSYL